MTILASVSITYQQCCDNCDYCDIAIIVIIVNVIVMTLDDADDAINHYLTHTETLTVKLQHPVIVNRQTFILVKSINMLTVHVVIFCTILYM